ncbi:MAG: helix-turn-helix transcriptional regulator [Emcibacter sp.]|nr:helix-turn-helix transcriptional regulator [Emcibacter sp.]
MNSSSDLTMSEYYDTNNKISDASSYYDMSHKILSPLSQLVGAESSIFGILKKTKRGIQVSNVINNGVDKKNATDYEKYFQNADPVLPHAFNSTQVCYQTSRSKSYSFTLSNIINPQKFSCSQYYKEFLQPSSIQHVMTIGVPSGIDPSLIYILGFHRYCDHPFQQKDMRLSSYFGPTLFNIFNALELKSQLHDRDLIVSGLQNQISDTGLIIVNENHNIIFSNQTGQRHFNIKPASKDHYIELESSLKTKLKSQLPLTDKPSPSRIIEFNHGATTVSARVITSDTNKREQRIILHTKRSSHKIINSLEMEKYNLTRRETEIAHLIIMGLTNPEISLKLFISISTVENHLRSIFSKANVKNRTSLAYELSLTQ